MILNSLYVFCYYFLMIASYFLGIGKKSKFYQSGKNLVDRPQGSHRLIDGNKLGLLVIPAFYYRLVYSILFIPKKFVVNQKTNGVAVYDEANDESQRLDFIYKMTGELPSIYINKQELLRYEFPFYVKISLSLVYFVYSLFLLPFTLSKNRQLYALLLHEIYELSVLLLICKKYKIRKLYYSCIFEKDSNSSAYILQKKGLYIIKNPSEDPLYFHNKFIIADELGICNDYQWEELEAYKATIFVNKFQQWLPEQYDVILNKSVEKKTEIKNHTIGYYSGASWLNAFLKNNLTTDAYNPYKAEEELELNLANFLKEHNNYHLKIYLHPLEKRAQYIHLSIEHYDSKFNGLKYEIADIKRPNYEMFNECEIGVTVFSGIMIYRFYQGLKGIYYNPYFPNYPIKGSTFDSISAKNEVQLSRLILEVIELEDAEFKNIKLHGKYNKSF